MSKTKANGIQIEYETFGNASGRPLLLIMGLGGQLIFWNEDFCRELASRGHYVIIYDNRDVGLSTKFDQAGEPDIIGTFMKIHSGDKSGVPYMMEDMADDGAGLLDALGIASAHICGISMGGMIAQTIAIRHPSKVLTLTSIMSTTGNPDLPQPRPDVQAALVAPPPLERNANIEYQVGIFRMLAGCGFPHDEEWTRKVMTQSYDRCLYPQGMGRQTIAIMAQNNRKAALASLKTPTLVIHGTDDPLVPLEGGKDTAASIGGAKLLLIEGMGHDLPRGAWSQIVDAISELTQKAG
ncbi:MAG: alpha/beta hydrolase [Deltaproteobacteria bacterium]|nr:alpha/beta hydrolase [Deltaproteobacteria bacterium]